MVDPAHVILRAAVAPEGGDGFTTKRGTSLQYRYNSYTWTRGLVGGEVRPMPVLHICDAHAELVTMG